MSKFRSGDVIVSSNRGGALIKAVYTNDHGGGVLYEIQHIGRRLGVIHLPADVVEKNYKLCEDDGFLHNDAMSKVEFCVNELLASRDILPVRTIEALEQIKDIVNG